MRTGRVLWTLFIASAITACGTERRQYALSDYPSTGTIIIRNEIRQPESDKAQALSALEPASGGRQIADSAGTLAAGADKPPGHCRLKDRFDRKNVIAYHFSDHQTRLGFDVDGVEVGDLDIDAVRINFSYRFQPIKKKRERCLYNSAWQGLVGSGYNELVVRENHTVYQELDDEIDDVRDKFSKLF